VDINTSVTDGAQNAREITGGRDPVSLKTSTGFVRTRMTI